MFKIIIFFVGICGFAFQILLNRTLSTMFGAISYIQGSILFSFILFAGVGALISDRMKNQINYILISLGLFSFSLALLWNNYLVLNIISDQNIWMRTLISIIVISPAGILIGTLIPILTDLKTINDSKHNSSESFVTTYLFYHLGAAAILLLFDSWWIPILGLKAGFILLGLVMLITLALINIKKYKIEGKISYDLLSKKDIVLISSLSLISGISQFAVLKSHYHFFGPFPENFSFILITSLLSLSIASIIAKSQLLNKTQWLKAFPYFISAYLFYLWGGIYVHSYFNSILDFDIFVLNKLIRFFGIFLLFSPLYIYFGLLLPLLHSKPKYDTKRSLALNCIFNAVGFAGAVFVLHQWIILKYIYVLVALLITGFMIYFSRRKPIIPILLVLAWALMMNKDIFHLSYHHFSSIKNLNKILSNIINVESYRKAGTEVSLLETDRGKVVVIDGYRSLRISKTGQSIDEEFTQKNKASENKYEFIMGALQAFISQKRENSLILGVGSGITVNANSQFFKNVEAVEINPVILDMQKMLNEYNYNLNKKDNVEIIFDDGFNYLLQSKKKYDLIVNNVPTPRYSVSAKIWTTEFMDIIYSKLNDTGVFSVWLNAGVNEKATKVIFKTIAKTFSHCYLGILHPLYSNIMCVKTKLPDNFIFETNINNTKKVAGVDFKDLKYFLFPIKYFKNIYNEPLNTLNNPTLPFYLESKYDRIWYNTKAWYTFDMLEIDWLDMKDFKDKDIKKRCIVLQKWLNGFPTPFCPTF